MRQGQKVTFPSSDKATKVRRVPCVSPEGLCFGLDDLPFVIAEDKLVIVITHLSKPRRWPQCELVARGAYRAALANSAILTLYVFAGVPKVITGGVTTLMSSPLPVRFLHK